jgi:Holliday junction DNA helicase RuvA
MITLLRGKLLEALPTQAVVDVHGVGYEVLIPLSSFDKLPPVGSEITLLTHLAVREDAHTLYGFMTSGERDLFRLLIHCVSGIGPKIALNILSGISATAFRAAVAASDVKALSQISGVGKKTAERIVVELKDKLGATAVAGPMAGAAVPVEDRKLADATAALIALGVKPIEAQETIKAAIAMLGPQATVEQLVRASLKKGA